MVPLIKENQQLLNKLNCITDCVMIFAAMPLAYWMRFFILAGDEVHVTLSFYLWLMLGLLPAFLIIYALAGMYESFRTKRFFRELKILLFIHISIGILLTGGLFLIKVIDVSRLTLVFFCLFSFLLVTFKRGVLRLTLGYFRSSGYNLKHVLLIGCGKNARAYVGAVEREKALGYRIDGYVAQSPTLAGLKYMGGFDNLRAVLDCNWYDELVYAMDASESENLLHVINESERSGLKLSIIPYYAPYMPTKPYIDELGGLPLINTRRVPLDNVANAFIKRAGDIICSCILIALTSPFMLIAAAGTKLSSPGPMIFRQKRVGKNQKVFEMYKFRSMRVNAASNIAWSTNEDPRKTRFGAIIRKLSIDELPQFFNVLKGDMSLVGPRPELPHFVDQFKEVVPRYMVKHQVRPGITGWAQVNGLRGDTSIPDRVNYDIDYIEHWSPIFDLKIMLMTIPRLMNGEKVPVRTRSSIS